MKKTRIADQYKNMINGQELTVIAIDGDIVTFDNGSSADKKQLENCFKFVGNDTPFPVPEAEIASGTLFIDGLKIETGLMKPEEILATVPGAALIVIDVGKGKRAIVRYDVVAETFKELVNDFTKVETLVNEEGIMIYKTINSKERKVAAEKEGDDPVTIQDYIDHVFIVKDGKLLDIRYDMILGSLVAKIVADDGTMQFFFERKQKLTQIEDVDGYKCQIVEDMEGMDLVSINIVEVKDEDEVNIYVDTAADHFSSEVKSINQIHDGHKVFVVTESGIHVFGRKHMAIGHDVLDVVAAYPILVRFTACSHEHDHDTFVLANSNYEVKTIRVKRVGDPVGYVTNIE